LRCSLRLDWATHMRIELMSFGAVVGVLLVIVAKLTAHRQRSWVQRDLQRGDLSFLTDFAFFRNRRPPSAMSMTGTVPVRCVLVHMGSESEYLANARECEGRAQEMPPALRHTFVSLAAHWRKLASNAAEGRRSSADSRNSRSSKSGQRLLILANHRALKSAIACSRVAEYPRL